MTIKSMLGVCAILIFSTLAPAFITKCSRSLDRIYMVQTTRYYHVQYSILKLDSFFTT